MRRVTSSISLLSAAQAAIWLGGGVMMANPALAKDNMCVNYYTIGDSNCQPLASTPVKQEEIMPGSRPTLVSPPSEVDRFLENYGKPPREFVEFYLNPTPQNAAIWSAKYQEIIQKNKTISKMWTDTEAQASSVGAPVQGAYPSAPSLNAPVPTETPASRMLSPQPSPVVGSFGGLAAAPAAPISGVGGVRQSPVKLTYYFSQICPYCAKMTPDLAVLSNEKANKLAFTCVDVTPVGPQIRPNESYITSKLPCKWRLPEEGEVESQRVNITPTLLIQRDGSPEVRLSGYVPLSQLRQYF